MQVGSVGSGIGGVGVAKATTNVRIMEALKESLHRESGTSSCNSIHDASAIYLDDDEDEDDDDEYGEDYELDCMDRKKMLLDRVDGETKLLMADLNLTNGRAKPLSTCQVRGRNIQEFAFTDSKEDKNNEGCTPDDSKDEGGSFAKKSEGDRSEDDSKNEGRESSEPLQRPRRRRAPPERRVQRQSFCASLKDVTEDKEEVEGANATRNNGDGDVAKTASPAREDSRPERRPSRFRSKQRSSLQFPRDNSIRLSSIFNSDTRISLSSFQRSDSIDLMDFGVDHHRGPLFANNNSSSNNAESARSLVTGATGESMSNFVDSEGFLGWGSNSNDDTCNNDNDNNDDSSGCDESEQYDHDEKEDSSTSITAVGENGNNEKSSSILHDSLSSGFLSWDGRIYDSDSSRKLKPDDDDGVSATTENENDKNNEPPAEERNLKAGDDDSSLAHSKIQFGAYDGPATADDVNGNTTPPIAEEAEDLSSKSWNIEDYEDPNDNNVINNAPTMMTTTKRVSSSTTFTGRMANRLSQRVQGLERGLWNNNNLVEDDEPKDDGIRTSVVKRILLTGRNPNMDKLMLSNNRNETKQKNYTTAPDEQQQQRTLSETLFGGIRRSSGDTPLPSSNFDDYSRPAIIINREDDVDIGELRKELLEAGSKTS